MTYRLWVNKERTVLVRVWEDGGVEVSTRETPAHVWGTPIVLLEDEVGSAGDNQIQNYTEERGPFAKAAAEELTKDLEDWSAGDKQ